MVTNRFDPEKFRQLYDLLRITVSFDFGNFMSQEEADAYSEALNFIPILIGDGVSADPVVVDKKVTVEGQFFLRKEDGALIPVYVWGDLRGLLKMRESYINIDESDNFARLRKLYHMSGNKSQHEEIYHNVNLGIQLSSDEFGGRQGLLLASPGGGFLRRLFCRHSFSWYLSVNGRANEHACGRMKLAF